MKKHEYELVIKPQEINFAPETLLEEVTQNVLTVCSTVKFSVPLDRDFGVEARYLDDPVNSAKAKLCGEIMRAVRKYEPRAKVTRIEFSGTQEGGVYPVIRFRIEE